MTRPFRVAHIVASVGATGVESHLIVLLSALDRSQVEPTLFVPCPGPLVDRLRACRVAIEFGAPMRKFAFAETAELALRWAGSFDIVHAHGPRAIFWAQRAARRARVPFVATIHELRWITLPPGPKRSLWIALEEHALVRADHIIAVSEDVRRAWLSRRPELAGRMSVVHGSAPVLLDPDRVPRARPYYRTGESVRLVTLGRFNRVKGYDLLLPVVAKLAASGVECTLTVIGAGELERELRALATQLGIEPRVRWVMRPDDIPTLLAEADLFVTATRTESFGIAVLEAMAVGLPVVAPAVGGLTELVADGETGVLVPPRPESALIGRLADAVAALTGDPARAARLGAAAFDRARGAFGAGRLAGETASVYRIVLGSASPT